MIPIAMAVLERYDDILGEKNAKGFSIAILLGIAHASTVGGISTLVGTPPNLVFASLFQSTFPNGPEISFTQWLTFAFPLSIAFFFFLWLLLSFLYLRKQTYVASKEVFRKELDELGKIKREEKVVLTVFVMLALLWVTRKNLVLGLVTLPGWSNILPMPAFVGDGTAAIAMGILLFLLPAGEKGKTIMDWEAAKKLPWHIVLLFGGGFALAGSIRGSGLADWMGTQLTGLSTLSPVVMTASIATIVTFMTELTSNTATTQMVLPILAAVAISIGRNPLYLMIPATLSASCAFMMPVATPPNAIVFGTGRLKIMDMAKGGILINIMGAILITILVHTLGQPIFGSTALPDWAVIAGP